MRRINEILAVVILSLMAVLVAFSFLHSRGRRRGVRVLLGRTGLLVQAQRIVWATMHALAR